MWRYLWLLWLAAAPVWAQPEPTNDLQGRITEVGTSRPLPEAMITVTSGTDEAKQLVAFADADGRFFFAKLAPGEWTLAIDHVGYLPLTADLTLKPNESFNAEYELRRTHTVVTEMVVYGDGPEQEISRQSLDVAEIEKLPGFGGDVIKSLQSLPSVARPTMNDPGAIVVRGSGNYDTRFLLDGVDIPLLFHFGGIKSTYNSLSLGSVDLYPGGFGTRYGGSIGGIVELKGRPAKQDGWRTVLDASLLDVSFHTEGQLGKGFGLAIGARRSFVGELASTALKNNDDIELAVAPYYWDAIARLDYRPNRDHRFFLTFFAASDRMEMILSDDDAGSPAVSEATDEIAMNVSFSRIILGYDAYLGDNVFNELRLAGGRDQSSMHMMGEFRFEGDGPIYNLRDDLAVTWHPDFVSHLGVDLVYTPYNYEVVVNGYPESKLEGKEYSDTGVYTNVEWRPMRDLLITPGVRYDYYEHLKKGKTSVRAAARWDYHYERTFTASAGTYNQAPMPSGQSTDPVYGNPDLPPTTARHLTLGHEWRLGDRLALKIEAYHNTQDDVPAFADTANLNFLPDAEARMYGLEFMLRHESDGGFFGWLSYSIGRSERRFARNPGDGTDWAADSWALHDMDQTHHLEAVGSWELGKNWSFGSRVQFVSGVPITPIMGYVGDQYEFDGDTGNYVPVEGEYHSERVEPYFRTDLRVDKKFYRDNSVWSLYLDLQNANYFIYNSPEGYTYNYDYSKREPYGWIFVPALGVRVEF